jgi:hypothetical protein
MIGTIAVGYSVTYHISCASRRAGSFVHAQPRLTTDINCCVYQQAAHQHTSWDDIEVRFVCPADTPAVPDGWKHCSHTLQATWNNSPLHLLVHVFD